MSNYLSSHYLPCHLGEVNQVTLCNLCSYLEALRDAELEAIAKVQGETSPHLNLIRARHAQTMLALAKVQEALQTWEKELERALIGELQTGSKPRKTHASVSLPPVSKS